MYKLKTIYPHDTLYCIKCKKLMYMSNYQNHLKTKIHNEQKKKKKLIDKGNYILNFN